MREIGAFEAKTHLSQLLESVSHGESFAITKHGKIIAFLTPSTGILKLTVDEAIAGIMQLQNKIAKRKVKLSLAEIQKMKETGRR